MHDPVKWIPPFYPQLYTSPRSRRVSAAGRERFSHKVVLPKAACEAQARTVPNLHAVPDSNVSLLKLYVSIVRSETSCCFVMICQGKDSHALGRVSLKGRHRAIRAIFLRTLHKDHGLGSSHTQKLVIFLKLTVSRKERLLRGTNYCRSSREGGAASRRRISIARACEGPMERILANALRLKMAVMGAHGAPGHGPPEGFSTKGNLARRNFQ